MKILLLFSGGLDSILCYRILKENNFSVKAIQFFTPFLGIKDTEEYIGYYQKKFNIKVDLIDVWEEFKYILANPSQGYGKNLNPCLDCKLLFYKKAKFIMEEEGFDCIATGEVIGQRPFSQQRNSLTFLEKHSGLEGKILRPLSYDKSLKIPEKTFYNITGRGRKKQFELAERFNIAENITPAGGCLLTDPNFSKKCRIVLEFFDNNPENLKKEYFEIIKYGRLKKIGNHLMIIGKDEKDNAKLLFYKEYIEENSIYLISANCPSPVVVILKNRNSKNIKINLFLPTIKKFIKPCYRDIVIFNIF